MELKLVICDDERVETDYLTKLTSAWASARKIPAAISSFDSAEAFLFSLEEQASPDILLLDIQMKGIDGVTLAKRLRADGGRMQIAFVTGVPDFIAEGYEVAALHYLMKPVRPEKLEEVLDRAVERIGKQENSVVIDTADGPVRLFPSGIHYVEAFAHTTAIHTKDGPLEARASIGELEEALGADFCRVHRSYLVGLRFIRQITKADVVMDDGKDIPLSRRRYDEVNRAFIHFFRRET